MDGDKGNKNPCTRTTNKKLDNHITMKLLLSSLIPILASVSATRGPSFSNPDSIHNEIVNEWERENYCMDTEEAQIEMQSRLGMVLQDISDAKCLDGLFSLSKEGVCESGLAPLIRYRDLVLEKQGADGVCNLVSHPRDFPEQLKRQILKKVMFILSKQDRHLQQGIDKVLKENEGAAFRDKLNTAMRQFPAEEKMTGPILDWLLFRLGLDEHLDLMSSYLNLVGSLRLTQPSNNAPKQFMKQLEALADSGENEVDHEEDVKRVAKDFIESIVDDPNLAMVVRHILEPGSPYGGKITKALKGEKRLDLNTVYPTLAEHYIKNLSRINPILRTFLLNAHVGVDDGKGLGLLLDLLEAYSPTLNKKLWQNKLETDLCARSYVHIELVRIFRKVALGEIYVDEELEKERPVYQVFDGFEEGDLLDEHPCEGMTHLSSCLSATLGRAQKLRSARAFDYKPEKTINVKQFGNRPCSPGDFVLGKVLGRGAFGTAYLAHHKSKPKDPLVIKKIPGWRVGSAPELVAEEERLMAKLTHPHVAPLYCAYQGREGEAYFVMPLLEGGSLGDLIKEKKTCTSDEALKYFKQILSALKYLHSDEIRMAHLDLKPDNVLLDKKGNAYLIDFGLAAHFDEKTELVASRGKVAGTPEYMPPEAHLDGQEGPANDCYAVGILLHELVTGKPPYYLQSKEHPEALNPEDKAQEIMESGGLNIDTGSKKVDQKVEALTVADWEQRLANCRQLMSKLKDK